MENPQCPNHPGIYLQERPTQHGTVWRCPVHGCTVRWWGKPDTTPCDYETATARGKAHIAIIGLGNRCGLNRGEIYRRLGKELGVRHIGLSDKETCERVIEWAKQLTKET